jgi:hypothetical protein
MIESFEIPGMYLTREDVGQAIFLRNKNISFEKAQEWAKTLNDKQMERITQIFSEEFFDTRDGLFMDLVHSSLEYAKEWGIVMCDDLQDSSM